jgi:hypothetical protein
MTGLLSGARFKSENVTFRRPAGINYSGRVTATAGPFKGRAGCLYRKIFGNLLILII